mgnify:CR=1 FL=1
MHYPFISAVRRFFFIFLLFPFLLFPAAVVPCFFHPSFLFSVSYALSLTFFLIFRAGCCCLRFSMHYPFISAVRRFFFIFPLFPFLLFPAAVVPCFFHPSFLFSVSYALFLPFHLIFRAGCCCLRFSMHCPFISTVRRFSSFSLHSPSFYSPLRLFRVFFILFFIFRILRSFPAFSSHFSRRSFLRFFLVPGRK